GDNPAKWLAGLGRIMVGLVPDLQQNVLQYIVSVPFLMHDVSDDRFESAAMARIKFVQRFGPMVGNGYHQRFVGNPCAVCNAVLQSWIQHTSVPNAFLSFRFITFVCATPTIKNQERMRNRAAHRFASRSNP